MFKTNLQNLLDGALELFNKKKFVEAEKIYKQILEIDNKNAEAYCALGTISAIRKKYDEAINYFNITINYQPQNFYAYNNIGTIFYDFENFSKAIEYYSKALSINPDYLISLNMRALAYEKINDLISAINDYNKIRKKFPDDSFIDGIILFTKAKLCSWSSFKYELNKINNKILDQKLAWEPGTSLYLGNSIEIQSKTLDLYIKEMAVNEIDIAVDLNGYTEKNRFNVFFNRVAPVQINFLGYAGSMGFENMDYIIADKTLIPTNEKKILQRKNNLYAQYLPAK